MMTKVSMIKFFHIENDDNSTTCMPTQGIANTFRFHFLSSINFFIIVFSFLCALCRVFRNISCYSSCLFASDLFLDLLFNFFITHYYTPFPHIGGLGYVPTDYILYDRSFPGHTPGHQYGGKE